MDWIKLHRKSLDSRVFSDPFLWQLWCWCLMRANWKGSWKDGREIKPGQFTCGRNQSADWLNCSPSKWYRGMKTLQEWGQIRMDANSKWTTVTVCNWGTYQQEEEGDRTANGQRVNSEWTANEQPVNTLKEGQERQEGKKDKNSSCRTNKFSDADMAFAEWMYSKIAELGRSVKSPNFNAWANTVRLMRERDKRTHADQRRVFEWANGDGFWSTNILSPDKLREKFDELSLKMERQKPKPRGQATFLRLEGDW